MMKHRKPLALLMTACMLLAVLPGISFADEVTDVIDNAFSVGETTTAYSDWSNTGYSGAEYAGNSAGDDGTVKLRTNGSNSGIVTTGSAGLVTSIEVVWNSKTASGRTLNVYGRNAAYDSAADLYDSDKQGDLLGTIVFETNTELTIDGEYAYVGLRSDDGAVYLDRIAICWETEGADPPSTTYTVSFDRGEGSGNMEDVTDATSPYTLPRCRFIAPEGMVFNGWMMAGGDGTVYAAGAQVVLEESNVTFIATWRESAARNYRLVTSDEDLAEGGTYLITSELFVDELYVMSNQTDYNRAQYKVTGVDGETITLDESRVAANADDALAFEFTLGGDANSGWTFYDAVTGGYLYAASSTKNRLCTESGLDDNGRFVFELGEDGAAIPAAQGENSRSRMHYNGESNIFSCYGAESLVTAAVYLYRLTEDAPVSEPAFYGQSLLLTGQIGLRFYMNLGNLSEEERTGSYMTFAIEGSAAGNKLLRAISVQDDFDDSHSVTVEEGTVHYFTCKLSPIQMADRIVATYHYGDGLTVSKTYAVKDYFETYDTMYERFTEKQQAVTEALADYGHYTQAFLASLGTFTLGTDYAEMDKFYTKSAEYVIDTVKSESEKYEVVIANNTCDSISEILYSVSVADQPTINVYFTPAEGYDGEITFKIGTKEVAGVQEDGVWKVQITDIAAHLMGKTFTVKATTANGTATVKVSVLSYVYGILNSERYAGNENARNAAASIYYYYKTAYDLRQANGE